jgi:cyclophilin family peptidyl-prolyl cis-trans isomerase
VGSNPAGRTNILSPYLYLSPTSPDAIAMFNRVSAFFATVLVALGLSTGPADAAGGPRVKLTTNLGAIVIELDAQRAPKTVANFLGYVRAGHYDNTIFHRVIPGFMIQGGGFAPGMQKKDTRAPIRNEANNGLRNRAGTIAMARTGDPHSASAQFFINTVDNAMLDHRSKSDGRSWGYAVFGRVVEGMPTVRVIEKSSTHNVGPYGDVPRSDVTIIKAEVLP